VIQLAEARARFLTVAEVADLMRVSSMTVYRLIKAGDLRALRVGKSFRINEDDLDQFLGTRYTQAG
jgi:excisionase family DNA binding protein